MVRELCGIEWAIGQGKRRAICQIEDAIDGREIPLRMLFLGIRLGILDALLIGSQCRSAVRALQREIALDDALGNGSMAPKLDAICAIEGIAERVIEVIMRVQRAGSGDLRDFAQCIPLKCRARGRAKAFQEQGGILPDEESTVANRREPLRGIGDRGVEAVPHLANGGEPCIHQRRLRYARVIRQGTGERGKSYGVCEGVKRAKARSV